MVVNHVMSAKIESSIFSAFVRYLSDGANGVRHVVTEQPIDTADIFHYHRPHLAERLRTPAVATVHHDLDEQDRWLELDRFVERYRQCTKVVCLNTIQAKRLKEMGIEDTVVIPHGFSESVFHRTLEANDRSEGEGARYTLGLVSKRYARRVKGEAYLHELMRKLDPEQVRFVFVGEGRSQEAEQARQLGFECRVYERLPYRLFGKLYQSLDFLLIPSWCEGGPACVPEAVASGVPMLGFSVGMVGDYLQDGKNGLLLSGVVSRDAQRISALLSNPEKVNEVQVIARAQSGQIPSWNDVAQRYQQVYCDIVQRAA